VILKFDVKDIECCYGEVLGVKIPIGLEVTPYLKNDADIVPSCGNQMVEIRQPFPGNWTHDQKP
jgi:hypothetical protein